MWKSRAPLLGAFLLLGSSGRGDALPRDLTAAALVAEARSSLSAELSRLDGGALTQALSKAAGTDLHLKVLLDPREPGTRTQGRALTQVFQGLSPGARAVLELRWAKGAGWPERRILADGQKLLRWAPGQAPLREDANAAAFQHRFDSRWAQALTGLPEALNLEDDLKSLPDPRDKEPRISRRRDAAPSAGSGQAQDKEGTP